MLLLGVSLTPFARGAGVTISWEPTFDEGIIGYRVYRYDPDKTLIYEGTEI